MRSFLSLREKNLPAYLTRQSLRPNLTLIFLIHLLAFTQKKFLSQQVPSFMLSQELQSPAVISFAVFGFVMTIGYIYYRVQRDKAARGAEGLPSRPKGSNLLEKTLQQELEELRRGDEPEAEESVAPEQRSVEEARRMTKKYYEQKSGKDDDFMGGNLPPHG